MKTALNCPLAQAALDSPAYRFDDANRHGALTDIERQWLYWRDCSHKVAKKSHNFQSQTL
jgi:hypothetical protein